MELVWFDSMRFKVFVSDKKFLRIELVESLLGKRFKLVKIKLLRRLAGFQRILVWSWVM